MNARSAGAWLMLFLVGCFSTVEPTPPAAPEAQTQAKAPPEAPAAEPHLVDSLLEIERLKGCNDCAFQTRLIIRDNPGVVKVKIHLAPGTVNVYHDANVISGEQIAASLNERDWPTTLVSTQDVPKKAPKPPADTDSAPPAAAEGTPNR